MNRWSQVNLGLDGPCIWFVKLISLIFTYYLLDWSATLKVDFLSNIVSLNTHYGSWSNQWECGDKKRFYIV